MIGASVKAFYSYKKPCLAPEVGKSILVGLSFAQSFDKVDFLDLTKFILLNLSDFATVDKFSIVPPILPPLILSTSLISILPMYLGYQPGCPKTYYPLI